MIAVIIILRPMNLHIFCSIIFIFDLPKRIPKSIGTMSQMTRPEMISIVVILGKKCHNIIFWELSACFGCRWERGEALRRSPLHAKTSGKSPFLHCCLLR